MISLALLVGAALIAVAMTGFFAGSETGAISANRLRLRSLQLEGDQRANDVIGLLSDTQKVLTVTLVGTNVFSILSALFAKEFFIRLLATTHPDASPRMADLLSLAVMTPVILFFGELIPKQFYREHADSLMMRFGKILRFFSLVFLPAVGFFNSITYFLLRPLGIRKGQRRSRFTKEDLKYFIGSGENGINGREAPPVSREADMIQSIFNLEKTLVREVMKPLVDLIALPLHGSTLETAVDTARRTGYSRLPIYENTIVNMIGYIDVYDILRRDTGEHTNNDLASFVKKPYYVPETKRIDDLLQDLLHNHISVAIVVDEYGGCSGFVTLEDLLEEIVGEIEDEFDRRSVLYYSEKPGVYIIDPRMDLDDLREEVSIDLPKRNCETLGGFIYSTMGRIPETGETFHYGDYIIKVLEVKDPKISRVRIETRKK